MNQGARGYQETLLVDTLDRMRRNPEGRKVVHLRLSRMLPQNRSPVRLKIITRMFRALESGRQIQIFPMESGDLVMIVNAGAQRDVNNIIHRIRTVYDSDPVTVTIDGEDRFASWYDLGLDSAMAIQLARDLRAEAQNTSPQAAAPQLIPIAPQILDDVQKKLAFANIVPFVRNQPVLRVNPGTHEAAIEYIEFFLSVGDLQRAAAPTVNLFADRWLFQDLSRTMDLRMLETVVRAPHVRDAEAISLNLNLETIVNPAFASFLDRLGKKRVVIELQLIDMLTNPSLYNDVQAALKSLGHPLLIDGLTTGTIRLIDVARFKPEYAKVAWSSELADTPGGEGAKAMQALIAALGPGKLILSRCESAAALAWGVKCGVTLFQGYFLDSLRGGRQKRG